MTQVPTALMPPADPEVLARRAALEAALRAELPDDAVITDPRGLAGYECDALPALACAPMLALLPRTTEEVAAALRICHAHRVPVVPRGAGTSLTGGALPSGDSVVLGLARMNAVLDLAPEDRLIHVQAGITNLKVSGVAAPHGLFYAPDPSSQLACAIGGNIAMNSGGAHCLKYGVTTHNLLGVRMVLMDGSVVDLGGPLMDNAGLDLTGLICGAEGQLGVVTEAWLRLMPTPQHSMPLLAGFDTPEAAGACVSDIIRAGLLPVAIEFMDRICIETVEGYSGAGYPICEALLVIEVEGSAEDCEDQLARIEAIARKRDPVELRVARDPAQADAIWAGRKAAFAAMGALGEMMCLDGAIPVSALPEALIRVGELSKQHDLMVSNVMHAGDGNLHPLILFDGREEGSFDRAMALGADILRVCVELGGCLTGEHGVGVEKRELMPIQYGPEDLEAQMQAKDVFDPLWLLNPAKVFPLEVSAPRRAFATQEAAQ